VIHPVLERQLKRLGLAPDTPPDAEQWALLQERIGAAYQTADTERYLLERSFALSSDEMQELHRTLRMREAEQAALRRVATAVASDQRPEAVFNLVAQEAASLLGAEGGSVVRFLEDEGSLVGLWAPDMTDEGIAAIQRIPLDGMSSSARVFQTGQPFRIDDYGALDDSIARSMSESQFRSGVAAPVYLKGRLWGAVVAGSTRSQSLPADADKTLAEFAQMIALAISNSESLSQLQQRATSDPLTGLANHREFHERLIAEVARAERDGAPMSLVMMDLDHFKQVNDIHGHQAGDMVLRETAERLRSVARAGETIGRVGGEEFAWILPGASGGDAHAAAERAREAISSMPYDLVGLLTVSCGVCDLETARSPQELMRLADSALYSAKSNGRDVTVTYQPGADQDLSARQRAERMERAHALHALRALARAIDAKDAYTQQHSERVADLAVRLATACGWSVIESARLREAGLVHDVGKIGVSDSILLKPGRLTPAEYRQVKEHAALGAKIVQEVLMEDQVGWVAHHHERWDGAGYPDGLAGEEIPEGARLLAIADTWDAITVERGYGSPLAREEALEECRRCSGLQFWPQGVQALEALASAGALGGAPGEGEDADAGSAPALAGEGDGGAQVMW
jgi:diguanylate cyclase (GGDEF)-like protein